jgi:hypothetical protein
MRKRSLIIFLAAALFYFATVAFADWGPAKRLTWTSGTSVLPALAVDSDNAIHVVWEDETPGNPEIYYRKTTDGGATWSAIKRLTWTPGNSSRPDISIDSNDNIHVVWDDGTPGYSEIYYKRSTDGGETWTADRRLTWTPDWSDNPALAIDSTDDIHLVWQDYTPGFFPEIYHKRTTDGGTTWSTTKRITWTAGFSFDPALAIDSTDALNVFWEDYTPGFSEIYHKKTTDGGTTWSTTKRITWTAGDSFDPAPATDSTDALHLVWYDDTPGNLEVHYKKTIDGGATWSVTERMTWTSGNSQHPVMAIDSTDAVHVVWDDDTPGDDEIYYKKSTNGGTTWSTVQRLTWKSGSSRCPALAIDSNDTIHIVWQDDTPGNDEIYYKKGN